MNNFYKYVVEKFNILENRWDKLESYITKYQAECYINNRKKRINESEILRIIKVIKIYD